jgi:hypothetical protein
MLRHLKPPPPAVASRCRISASHADARKTETQPRLFRTVQPFVQSRRRSDRRTGATVDTETPPDMPPTQLGTKSRGGRPRQHGHSGWGRWSPSSRQGGSTAAAPSPSGSSRPTSPRISVAISAARSDDPRGRRAELDHSPGAGRLHQPAAQHRQEEAHHLAGGAGLHARCRAPDEAT